MLGISTWAATLTSGLACAAGSSPAGSPLGRAWDEGAQGIDGGSSVHVWHRCKGVLTCACRMGGGWRLSGVGGDCGSIKYGGGFTPPTTFPPCPWAPNLDPKVAHASSVGGPQYTTHPARPVLSLSKTVFSGWDFSFKVNTRHPPSVFVTHWPPSVTPPTAVSQPPAAAGFPPTTAGCSATSNCAPK